MEETNEKDGRLNAPQEWGKAPTRMTSVNFDAHLHEEAKRLNISLRDVIEFGIKFKISDVDGWDYPPCNLLQKLHKTVEHRNALLQEVEALRKQLPRNEELEQPQEEDPAKEFDKIMEAKKDE